MADKEDLTQEIIDAMLEQYKGDKHAMTVALGYMNLIVSTRDILYRLEDNVISFMKEIEQCQNG